MGKLWVEEMSQGWLQGWVEAGLYVSMFQERCTPRPLTHSQKLGHQWEGSCTPAVHALFPRG